MHEKSYSGTFEKPNGYHENNFDPLIVNSRNGSYFYQVKKSMISSEKKSSNLRSTKIARQIYPHKKMYWQRVRNKLDFLQKENNLMDNNMLKKLRSLYKLKAKNLYLTSVIQHNIAVKSLLISFNNMLRSPVDMARHLEVASQHAYNFSSHTVNTLENDLLKEIMNTFLSTSNGKFSFPSQLNQDVLSTTSFTSEASRDFISRLERDSVESRELQNQVKD